MKKSQKAIEASPVTHQDTMNVLTVSCRKRLNEEGLPYYDIRFFIDGRNLVELVREWESAPAQRERQADLAGSYSHICHTYYTESYLLGLSGAKYGVLGDKTELLGCTCGCGGCWPLAVRIMASKVGRWVMWEDFEQPNRTWDYSGFGPFLFDLEQYLAEIRKIPGERQPSQFSDFSSR